MSGVKRNEKAVMLLGHGSKAHEANETLRKVAGAIRDRGGYGAVQPAFLQMEMPDFQAAADIMVADGFMDITVMPYFLYMGLHVTKDLPAEIDEARKRHPGLKVSVTDNLGFHEKLVEVAIERIDKAASAAGLAAFPSQHPIEKESFRILGAELGETHFSPLELPVVKRVIHSTADFEYKDLMSFSPGAVQAGVAAIRAGGSVITDVRMIEAGVGASRLGLFGSKLLCFSGHRDVAELAALAGITRTAASMRKAAPFMQGSVVAIGNAPTALTELLAMVREGACPAPELVVGVPVGFVGAAESKEALASSPLESILTRGRKGGSTVAVAIVNALAILAHELVEGLAAR